MNILSDLKNNNFITEIVGANVCDPTYDNATDFEMPTETVSSYVLGDKFFLWLGDFSIDKPHTKYGRFLNIVLGTLGGPSREFCRLIVSKTGGFTKGMEEVRSGSKLKGVAILTLNTLGLTGALAYKIFTFAIFTFGISYILGSAVFFTAFFMGVNPALALGLAFIPLALILSIIGIHAGIALINKGIGLCRQASAS